jgi:hypothetical protein
MFFFAVVMSEERRQFRDTQYSGELEEGFSGHHSVVTYGWNGNITRANLSSAIDGGE